MTTSLLLSDDIEKVLRTIEYRHDLLAAGQQTTDVYSEDLQRVGIDIEAYSDAAHYLAAQHPEIQVVRVYDFVNGENPTPAQMLGTLPPVASFRISGNCSALFATIRKTLLQTDSVTTLKGLNVSYDADTCTLYVGGKPCALPLHKNEAGLCKIMFGYKPGEYVSWDIIADDMGMLEGSEKDRMRPIQDARYNLNERVAKTYKTKDKLLGWQNKNLCRNY